MNLGNNNELHGILTCPNLKPHAGFKNQQPHNYNTLKISSLIALVEAVWGFLPTAGSLVQSTRARRRCTYSIWL